MIQDKTVQLSYRPRRLRVTGALRDLVAQTQVRPTDLIAPFFVVSGTDVVQPIGSLPGVSRLSPDRLLRELERGLKLGVRAAMIFGVVPEDVKDPPAKAPPTRTGRSRKPCAPPAAPSGTTSCC
jgi:porphobilinogen synthase